MYSDRFFWIENLTDTIHISLFLSGTFGYFKFYVIRLDKYVGPAMMVALVAEILVVIYVFYFIGKEIGKMRKQKKEYFKVDIAFYNDNAVPFCWILIRRQSEGVVSDFSHT